MPEIIPGARSWDHRPAEIWADGVVHVLGLVGATAATVALLVVFLGEMPAGELAAVVIYVATLVLAISASLAYNMWPVSPTKWLLRRFDHSGIYLLIAGTYTPFAFKSGVWWLLIFVWTLALLGVFAKLFLPGRFDRFSIGIYLALGWSGLFAIGEVTSTLSPLVLWLVVAGGATYSLGVPFHVWERLRFRNAIWHGFVITAAGIHFAAVWASCAATIAV
ncbi:hemolysin III family protein [Afifella sp. IM 167]|uniref:PAQR family membrane homeostasis protein TrhA n=1 Tax=Afifella sp. IM 167 TaxID=2033586 RepID=UPI001CD0358B|nr:hemolysin III family protein [Afifella sp. IM 167]MBZ8133023.1 DNA-binding protein [Afifella sp. IM 167]